MLQMSSTCKCEAHGFLHAVQKLGLVPRIILNTLHLGGSSFLVFSKH